MKTQDTNFNPKMSSEGQELSDNELIAVFDGWEKNRYPNLPNRLHRGIGPYERGIQNDQLKYNTSWDWLMPVVEKIASDDDIDLKIYLYPDRRGCTIFGLGECPPYINIGHDEDEDSPTLLQKTYKAVVEFIKWYKTQTP